MLIVIIDLFLFGGRNWIVDEHSIELYPEIF